MRALVAVVLVAVSMPAGAAWEYLELKDDFSGETSHVLQVESSLMVAGADLQQYRPFLQLRCDKEGNQPYWRIHWFAILDVSISSVPVLGVVESTMMQVRIDGKADNRMIWSWNRDETLKGMTTYRAPPIVKALSGASELKLRAAGAFGKTYDATFDVSGLPQALGQLRPHCKRL